MGSTLDYRIIKGNSTKKELFDIFDGIVSGYTEPYSGKLDQKEGLKITKKIFSSDDNAIKWISINNDRDEPAVAVKVSEILIPKSLLNKLKKAEGKLKSIKEEYFYLKWKSPNAKKLERADKALSKYSRENNSKKR